MALSERVNVARRYQRAIRIDTDIGDSAALEGFICPKSSVDVLETMAKHILASGHGAFTWTGPYGGGKSSLAVILGALLNGRSGLRKQAASILGERTTELLMTALPPRSRGWRVIPVCGRRDSPVQVIGEAIEAANMLSQDKTRESWTEVTLFEALKHIATQHPRAGGGLALFIDELGKFLEAAARDDTDIHLFQQLAEFASRSNGRFVVIGILHQSFEEYAYQLSREMRDEWSKIQGRYVDLPINVAAHEQIDLLARAIESDGRPPGIDALAQSVVENVPGQNSPHLATMLADCWPLHPTTALLLGPLSRRRFGQNQRSLFGFLNSAEPLGFRSFLREADETDLYGPEQLWDYLRVNLEPSILVSPDGHRWALAADALGRCQAMGGNTLHAQLLQTIALLDLLKERSGLPSTREAIGLALTAYDSRAIDESLEDLRRWSLIAFRKFTASWAIFEGSDFDIEEALDQALSESHATGSELLTQFASLQPIVAKRHYHETGSLRWFDVGVVPLEELEQVSSEYVPRHGGIGTFLLTIPSQFESEEVIEAACRKSTLRSEGWDVVAGVPPQNWNVLGLAAELAALERVRDESPELHGDRVARTEVRARISSVRERIESELSGAFDGAYWCWKGGDRVFLTRGELNGLASDLADSQFRSAPWIHNELVVRTKPSSNAVGARNALLRRMVLHEKEERLGISGFPAEGGLYVSLLEATGLHRETEDGWGFSKPLADGRDMTNLAPAWHTARKLLEDNCHRAVPVSEIHELWERAPFGIKRGVLPVLSMAFVLSQRNNLAFYREGVFQSNLSDLEVDYLVRDPSDIQLRWMDLSGISRRSPFRARRCRQ